MNQGILPALERIEYQLNDDFGQKLELLVAQLCEDIRTNGWTAKKLDGYPVVKKMEDFIFRRIGLKFSIFTTKGMAAVMPYYSNKNHIFLADFFRGAISLRDQNKALEVFSKKKGVVNLKEAKVGGAYSEYTHPLYLNFCSLVNDLKLTPGEITAAMLHEIGHAFGACYYADRTDETNQVMAYMLRVLTDHNNKADVEHVYREIKKCTDDITKEEVDKMMNGPRVVAGTTWFMAVIRMVKSQMKNNKYSETAFEENADSFATRFGYGKNLVATLDKLHDQDYNKSRSAFVLSYLFEGLLFAALAGMIFAALAGGSVVGVVYFAVLKLIIVRFSGEDSIDYTYDKLVDRYKRVRQDTIDLLKDKDLPPETVKVSLEAIYQIDDSMKSTLQYKGIYNSISNFLFTDARRAKDAIESQKFLETLANNDLFMQSAEFRTNARPNDA